MDIPDSLSEWSLHCFCLGARETPHALVRHRPIGRLLFEAADWCDLDALRRRGCEPTARELDLLQEFRLLDVRADRVRRSFPALGPDVLLPVRREAVAFAASLMQGIAFERDDLLRELHALGMDHAGYSVLVGHIFDGLLWDCLRPEIDLPDTRLTAEHPLWRGVFWALHPGIPGASGTNEFRIDAAHLTVLWSPLTSEFLDGLRIMDWFQALLRYFSGADASAPAKAVALGLVDGKGCPRVPVFGAERFSTLSRISQRIAAKCAGSIVDFLNERPLLMELRPPERNVILVHELIWAIEECLKGDPTVRLVPEQAKAAMFARIG